MSSFDDEFGLFGGDAEDAERRPTLGARKLSAGKKAADEAPHPRTRGRGPRDDRSRSRDSHAPGDPVAAARRASSVLEFVAKRLVGKPDDVTVDLFADEDGRPVIELVVDPEDLGKVIGRSGRVAHALRTLVRATAEGRISVDILDSEEAAEGFDEDDGDDGDDD